LKRKNNLAIINVIVTILLLFTSGCSYLIRKMNPPLEPRLATFNVIRPDLASILNHLGPPHKITATPEGMEFLYEHYTIREWQLGFSIPYEFLNYFKFVFGRGWNNRQSLVMSFDHDNNLLGYQFTKWREQGGTGASIQILIEVSGVVDMSYVDEEVIQLIWGRTYLRSLPIVLNLRQNLETGQNGLEQTGTTKKVGQHTLEMRQKKKTGGFLD
jgi:hypothetical protein